MRTWRVSKKMVMVLGAAGCFGLAQASAGEGPAADEVAAPLATEAPTAVNDAPVSEAPAVEGLPMPEALAPQVLFWKRVYTEVDTKHGFIHDSHHLDVVYATVTAPQGSRRMHRRWLAEQKAHYGAILTTLAHGKRAGLTAEEAQVLGCWPADVSEETLQQAARSVRFQAGQRDKFVAGLLRSRAWMPHIVSTFAKYGLPRELAALPHVESSFDLRAYSKARAAGIFQFTAATARLFMQMNNAVDERLDPLLATEAAAKLLASNYRRTGAWPVAITSYNHGVDGMRRAMRALNTSDLTEIIAHYHARRFGFASRNFYAELLAAWDVSQHAEQYFGTLPAVQDTAYATVTMDAFYKIGSIASALGVDVKTLKEHNMALRPGVWSGAVLVPQGFTLRVPQVGGVDPALADKLALIPRTERFASAGQPELLVASAKPAPRRAAPTSMMPAMTSEAQQATSGVVQSVYSPDATSPMLTPWRPDNAFSPLKN